METLKYYFGEFMNSPYTQNTIDFVNVYFTEILLWVYILLSLYATFVIYKQWKLIRKMRGKTLALELLAWSLSWILLDKFKEVDKLKETLKGVRNARDKKYNKHNTQIAYYKKRFFALMLSVKENFVHAPAMVRLLKNDFYILQKKSFKELRKREKKFDNKQK